MPGPGREGHVVSLLSFGKTFIAPRRNCAGEKASPVFRKPSVYPRRAGAGREPFLFFFKRAVIAPLARPP